MKRFYGKSAALFAAAVSLGAASAFGAEPTQQELLEQIQQLRSQVEKLEHSQQGTEQRLDAKEVDATVDSVLKDADHRSQFLADEGFTAGYSKGKFLIQSADGNFTLNPQVQFQFRYAATSRDEANHAVGTPPVTHVDDDDIESGFEVRRLRASVNGTLFKDFTYRFLWQTDRTNGQFLAQDVWVKYQATPTWAFKGGQFQDPWVHEEAGVSSARQLAVDRSLLNEWAGGGDTDRVQGITAIWDDGKDGSPFRAEFGYTDGSNTDNTSFVDSGGSATFDVANPNYGLTGRLEYIAFGDWKSYDDFTALGNTSDLLVFGAGASFTEAGNSNALYHTVDVQYETGRWGLYAAYIGIAQDNDNATGGNFYDWGALAQAGYLLTDKWEIFGRYDFVQADDSRFTAAGTEDFFPEITAGVNYYIEKHAAKVTLDLTYLPNGTPLTGSTATGVDQLDNENDEAEIVFRAQFQLVL